VHSFASRIPSGTLYDGLLEDAQQNVFRKNLSIVGSHSALENPEAPDKSNTPVMATSRPVYMDGSWYAGVTGVVCRQLHPFSF
jgi:hypothetical protein